MQKAELLGFIHGPKSVVHLRVYALYPFRQLCREEWERKLELRIANGGSRDGFWVGATWKNPFGVKFCGALKYVFQQPAQFVTLE